jgi:hypothetical protein
MVYPIDADITAYFDSPTYLSEVQSAQNAHHFDIFEQALRRNMESSGLAPWDGERARAWLASSGY